MASPETCTRNGFTSEPQQKKKKNPYMVSPEISPENRFALEPPQKKRKKGSDHDDNESNITKSTLLKALQDIEESIGDLTHGRLRKRLENMRRQVEGVLENQKKEMEWLDEEIRVLKRRIEMVKNENAALRNEKKRLNKTLALAQATWVWEAHLVRFVIYSTEDKDEIHSFNRFEQMTEFLKNADVNMWRKIQGNLGKWTKTHWAMVKKVREERNFLAHPSLVDLDLVKDEIPRMPPKFRKEMKHMLDIIKMTTSLMKFGRLASSYKASGQPTLKLTRGRKKALKEIISWDRRFEQIDGLQNIEHEEAKTYLKTFVDDGRAIHDYFSIVDDIKKGNSNRLGKLAQDFAERYHFIDGMTKEEEQALNGLKDFFQADKRNVTVLDPTIAKLHIPDFLPKELWKHGLKIVDEYSKLQ